MRAKFKPEQLFYLLCTLIVSLIVLGYFVLTDFKREGQNQLWHNLDEIQRSQEALYGFAQIKTNLAEYSHLVQLKQYQEAQEKSDKVASLTRNLQQELVRWNSAIKADLASSREPEEVKKEKHELVELAELKAALDALFPQLTQYLKSAQNTHKPQSEQYQDYQKIIKQYQQVELMFANLVRETKAESYLELDEFQVQVNQLIIKVILAFVLVLLLSVALYWFEKKMVVKPLEKIKRFLWQVRNHQSGTLEISHFGAVYAVIEEKLMHISTRLSEQRTELAEKEQVLAVQSTENSQCKQFFQQILDSFEHAIVVCQLDGEIDTYNIKARNLMGEAALSLSNNVSTILKLSKLNGERIELRNVLQSFFLSDENHFAKQFNVQSHIGLSRVSLEIAKMNERCVVQFVPQQIGAQIDKLYDVLGHALWITDEEFNVVELNMAAVSFLNSDRLSQLARVCAIYQAIADESQLQSAVYRELMQSGLWRGNVTINGASQNCVITRLFNGSLTQYAISLFDSNN